ncbi:MAG: 1,4-alpha-glucan-branching enzyme, partial [Bacteroidales bacterium]|nr:1,4-alpha-glucan-branching enzyme [Bacteroidales bacterium]
MKSLPIVKKDPWLKPYARQLEQRHQRAVLRELEFTDGTVPLKDVCNGHLYYGMHKTETEWIFREKAPNARQ